VSRCARALLVAALLAAAPAGDARAQAPAGDAPAAVEQAAAADAPAGAARCAHHDPLRSPFFGDLHVHTRYSLDASTQGTRTTPAQAYRFARGERLGLQPWDRVGQPGRHAQLTRPLDFAAVTDHSELFGEVATCTTPGLPGYTSFACRVYRGWPRVAFFAMNARGSPRFRFCGADGAHCLEAARGPWREMQEAAAAADDPTPACRFATLLGYEWTRSGPAATNLHRNVIFRGERVPEAPASSTEYPTPESLWDALDAQCRQALPGCDAVVIPHNSNLSGGLMFAPTTSEGAPLSARQARRRADNERLVEVMQHKGGSECARGAGTEDELCAFENLSYDSFMGRFNPRARRAPAASNFTRTAQGLGLAQQAALGANPFKFGLVGGTDTHLGAPGLVRESADYPGHGGAGIPIGEVLPEGMLDPVEYNPGGLAGVWAEENSREALFAALQRRETFATSGPRLVVRLFAGWDYPAQLCDDPEFARQGYAGGVPMGADLPAGPRGAAPVLAISALRDPGVEGRPGTPLQRLQVIKLWVAPGADGPVVRERVIDVAGDAHGGATVDTQTCRTSGTGADQLCAVWRDPDFDPAQPALYYARALENPTCRWTTWTCNAAGVRCEEAQDVAPGWEPCCDPTYPRAIQERAWTSPVWYTPPAGGPAG
jgi:hypothetical protein